MITAKFSNSYEAKKKRIQRLPKLVNEAADTFSKKDAVAIIDTFQIGIRENSFSLVPLADSTKRRKMSQGMPMPSNPLYGLGDDEKNSYINVFKIRKLKKGYRIYPRWAKHHDSSLSLRSLFEIHEEGRLITMPSGTIIRIPPRPAFTLAFRKHLSEKAKQETSQKVSNAMMKYVNKNSMKEFKEISKNKKELNKHDED